MRIAILGAGAMGLLFGGLLKKTGNNIKFIVRDESKKQIINEKGITLNVDDKTHIVYPEAILSKEAKEFDIIIIFTKTTHTFEALNSVKHIINHNTFLMSLQNGLGNLEKLSTFSNSSKIIYGTTMAPADLISVREISSSGSHQSQFKLAKGENIQFVKEVASIFNSAQLNSLINEDVENLIWSKVAFNTAMNTICALLEITPSSIEKNPKLKLFAIEVAKETCRVAKGSNIEINEDEVLKKIELSCKEHGDHKPSMLQDILLKKRTEIDSLNGAVKKIGSLRNIKTPLNSSLFHLIKAKENKFSLK